VEGGQAVDENERSIQSLLIRYVVAHTQCSGCGRRYNPEDVHIHDHRGDVWLASVTCSHCGLQGLIMAAIKTKDAQEIEATPEPNDEEWAIFEQMAPISSDEVLDFHRLLEGFSGDLARLFKEGNRQS